MKCKLEFLNFNDIIYKEIVKITFEKDRMSFGSVFNKNEKNRKKVVRKFINEYLEKFCPSELRNTNGAFHKNVIWKWNDEHEHQVSKYI